MNRPKALNALNSALLAELDAILADLETHDGLRAVLVSGAGEKSFVAGADIAEMRDKTPEEARAFALQALKALRTVACAGRRVSQRVLPRRGLRVGAGL